MDEVMLNYFSLISLRIINKSRHIKKSCKPLLLRVWRHLLLTPSIRKNISLQNEIRFFFHFDQFSKFLQKNQSEREREKLNWGQFQHQKCILNYVEPNITFRCHPNFGKKAGKYENSFKFHKIIKKLGPLLSFYSCVQYLHSKRSQIGTA